MASEIRVNKINSQTGVGTITLSPTGVDISGITTAATLKVGTGVTVSSDGDAFFTGVCTATSFSGDGSNLTGISAGTALSGSTDNTVTTVTGANAITGEANLKFDGGSTLTIVDTELAEASDNFSINIQSGNNDFYVKSGGTTFAAFKGSAKDLQLTSGNLVIGTSGKGIDFSATSDGSGTSSSELLDDYEEGTFTPSLQMDGGGANLGYAIQLGRYTKIGNNVHIEIDIKLNAINNNGSGSYVKVLGFPYTAATTPYGGFHCPYYNSANNTPIRGALLEYSDTFAYLYHSFENNGSIQPATIASAFGTSTRFMLVGSYTVA